MAVSPTMQDEVAFISNVASNGTLAKRSFYGWNQDNPATYNNSWTSARKWGGTTAGSSGGTVSYYFDPASNWSATEQNWLSSGLALWSAVANIKFVRTTSATGANISFRRINNGGSYTYAFYSAAYNAGVTGGKILGTLTSGSVNIDTTGTTFGPINGLSSQGGYTIENLLHEEGHALGLGHAGPYNGAVNTKTQQFSAYDNRANSLMSYIDPGASSKYPPDVKGWNWAGHYPTTWMPLDILAIQRLYGVAVSTPLDGGEVFGFHTNISGALKPFFDFTQNKTPVITLWDKGSGNTLDLSGFSGSSRVNLNAGTYSSTAGMQHNIAIAYGTKIDKLVCSTGGNYVTCNDNGDTVLGAGGADTIHGGNGNDRLSGGAGNDIFYISRGTDTIDGGAGTDTLVISGNRSNYTLTKTANGAATITGSSIKSLLSSIEVVKFADKTITLSPSALSAVEPASIGWDAPLQTPTMAKTASSASLFENNPLSTPLAAATPLSNAANLAHPGLLESRAIFVAATT